MLSIILELNMYIHTASSKTRDPAGSAPQNRWRHRSQCSNYIVRFTTKTRDKKKEPCVISSVNVRCMSEFLRSTKVFCSKLDTFYMYADMYSRPEKKELRLINATGNNRLGRLRVLAQYHFSINPWKLQLIYNIHTCPICLKIEMVRQILCLVFDIGKWCLL